MNPTTRESTQLSCWFLVPRSTGQINPGWGPVPFRLSFIGSFLSGTEPRCSLYTWVAADPPRHLPYLAERSQGECSILDMDALKWAPQSSLVNFLFGNALGEPLNQTQLPSLFSATRYTYEHTSYEGSNSNISTFKKNFYSCRVSPRQGTSHQDCTADISP